MYDKLRSVLCTCFGAGALAFVSLSASAASSSGQAFYFNRVVGSGANSAVYKVMSETEYAAAVMSRTRAATSAGGVALTELSEVTYLGKSWNIALTRTAERSALARAAALGGPVLGALGAAWFAYDLAKGFGLLGTADGWEYEEGSPPETLVGCVVGQSSSSSCSQACAADAKRQFPSTSGEGWRVNSTMIQGNDCMANMTYYKNYCTVSGGVQSCTLAPDSDHVGEWHDVGNWSDGLPVTACNEARPAVGADGKCRTVGLVDASPVTPSQAEVVWDGILSEDVVDTIQFARSLEQARVNYETSNPVASGPSEVEGPVEEKITNNPDGSSSTERTQLTINNQYSGSTINISTTNNSSVTNVSSSGQSTTTTTTQPGESAQSECAKNPMALGCAKMGDPPTDSPPAPTEDPVPSPSAVQFGSSSGCPQAITVTLPWGMTVLLEWVPLCDIASQFFAPLVLFLAAYAAFMGFVRSFTV